MMLIEWVQGSVFNEIAALLVLAAAVGFLGLMLHQPLIVSFIGVGILAGPSVLNIVQSNEQIQLLAELGIAVLLFLVGIKLDVKLIRTLGFVALGTGLGQVAFTSVIGFFICIALGIDAIASLYIAVALTFSSTIIIVKLLSDKREIDSLHGQIALGFLIVQDLVVVLAMIVLSAIGVGTAGDASVADVFFVLIAGVAMLAVVLGFVRYIADPLTHRLARMPELLIGFALALAASFAAIGEELGFGKELGGLLAGISLASTPFRDAIAARLSPLRDFLLLFFFIALGSRIDLSHFGEGGIAAIVLSVFVLVGNPLIVLLIMVSMGYRRRTGFLAGLTVAQISEFSLIFMAMGVALGHVTEEALALVTMIGLFTIAASTYMITYSHQLYEFCVPLLNLFSTTGRRETLHRASDDPRPYEIIVFGLGRYGSALGRNLAADGKRVLGVDFSPTAIRRWRRAGHSAIYGDASDPEFVSALPMSNATWAVSTIRDHAVGVTREDARVVLIQTLRERGFPGRIAVTANQETESAALYRRGADLVLEPYTDAAVRAAELLDVRVNRREFSSSGEVEV